MLTQYDEVFSYVCWMNEEMNKQINNKSQEAVTPWTYPVLWSSQSNYWENSSKESELKVKRDISLQKNGLWMILKRTQQHSVALSVLSTFRD